MSESVASSESLAEAPRSSWLGRLKAGLKRTGSSLAQVFTGTRIEAVLGWVPGSGRQTVGVCIFSYDGVVRVGFKVDATCRLIGSDGEASHGRYDLGPWLRGRDLECSARAHAPRRRRSVPFLPVEVRVPFALQSPSNSRSYPGAGFPAALAEVCCR